MKTNLKGQLAAACSNFNSLSTHFGVLFLIFFLWSSVGWGQVTVTNPSNTTPAMSSTYTSLALAIADVNNRTAISGPVTITLDASSPQTAPAGGYSITNTAITGGSNTNRFIFDGGGNTITAGIGTNTTTDAFFKIIGADFITIQNFVMDESSGNTTATTQIEWGIALLYSSTTNGAQNCIIQNNTITLNRTNPNSIGIYSNSTHSATAVTTSATATTSAGGNSGLKVYTNTINNVNMGIVVVGPTAAADANTGIDIGGSSLSTGNTISNYGTTTTGMTFMNVSGTINGILVRNSNGFNISYNTITSSNGGVTTGTLNGIHVPAPATGNTPTSTFTNNINNNTVSLTSGVSGAINGILYPSYPSSGSNATSTVNINNNNFTAATTTVANSSAVILISLANSNLITNINNNSFTNLSTNTTGSFTFINHSFTMPANGFMTITGNSIVTGFSKTGPGGTVTCTTTSTSSPSSASLTQTNNNFSNITVTGATGITGFNNFDGASSSCSKTIIGNTFNNWTGGTSSITGMTFGYWGGGTTNSISNNTITNITGQNTITALSLGSSFGGTNTVTVNGNTINNLSSTGTGGQVIGIASANTSTVININGNAINTLSSTGASSAVGGILITGATTTNVFSNTINGMVASGTTSPLALGVSVQGGTTVNTYGNKIYNISATGAISTTSPAVIGLNITAGTTVNSYNNLIGDLTAPSATSSDAVRGISITSTTASSSYNVYNNTVYLTGGSVGTNFGTSGIYHTANSTASTAKLDLQNNMIFNTCTPSGTGIVTAYRRSAATTLGNYASTSNKNLFYSGTPSATNTIMSDGTNNYQTITDYQTAVSTRDANSFTETSFNPATYFVSTTGSNANFLQPASGLTTQAEGGGNTIAMCSPDYNGVTRPGFSGAAFDLGAWEFAGVSPAPVLTNMVPSPALTSQCTKAARTISIDITTSSGSVTGATLNYSHNGTAQPAITMTNSSGNTWTGTMLAPSTGNATVTWSITATNLLGLTTSYTGTSYSDEPNTGITATASATPSSVCTGSTTSLSMSIGSNANAPSGYCTISAATSTQSYFDMFSTTGGITNITNASSGFSTNGYGNFTNLSVKASPNTTINFNTSLIGTTVGVALWVDWNQNGTFETTERMYVTSGYSSTASGSFTVPSGASFGNTRMRILMDYNNSAPSNPCGPFASGGQGEVEDYIFCVVPTPTSYSWSDGSSVIGTSNPQTATPSGTPTYTCTATVNGCSMTASVTPTVNPLPTAPTATNSSQCGTATPSCSVTGSGTLGNTFKWYLSSTGGTALVGQSGSNLSNYPVSSTTSFYVSEFNGTCESARTQVVVTVTQPDAISAVTSAAAICLGQSVTLTAANTATTPTQSYTYSWVCATTGSGATSANTNNPASVTPTAAGSYTYTVTGTDGACSAVNTVAVTVNALPTSVTASSNNSTICIGSSINLTSLSSSSSLLDAIGDGGFETGSTFPLNNWTVVNGANNIWSVGSAAGVQAGSNAALIGTGNVATANASVNHFYRDFVLPAGLTNISLSFYLKMAIIDDAYDYLNVYTTTTANTPVAGTLPGTGYTSVFSNTATAYSNYTLQSISLPNTLAGTTVRLVFTYKCDGVSPYSAPAIDNISLSAIPSSSYSWNSSPAGFTSSVQNPTGVSPTTNTTYTVTSTNSSGCSTSSSVSIVVNPSNTVSAASASPTICANSALTAITHTTTGATGIGTATNLPSGVTAAFASNTITISGTPTSSGTFNYSIPLTGGCGTVNATGTITVNQTNPPTGNATQSFCNNATIADLIANGTSVLWYSAATGGSALSSSTALVNGSHYYAEQTTNSCTSLTRLDVTVYLQNQWSGATSTDWSVSSNWTCNVVPGATENALIPTTGITNYPSLSGATAIKDINIGSGTLTLNGQTLTINGAVTGTGTISGSSSSNIIIGANAAAGTLKFTSGSNALKNLTLNAGSSASLGNALNIATGATPGVLTVNTGATLTTGGFLTLKSDATGTARVANSAGTISGEVSVERYIPQNSNRAWRALAVPTYSASQTIANSWQLGTLITGPGGANGLDQSTGGFSMMSYNPVTDALEGVGNMSNVISGNTAAPAAYYLYVRGDRNTGVANTNLNPTATTLSSKGSLYQGTVTVTAANNGSGTTYHLLGNPYVSPINLNSFYTANSSNLDNTFYLFDPQIANTTAGVGGLITLTGSGSSYTPSVTGASYSGSISEIPSGMAFFITKSSGSASSIVFNESMKTTGSTISNGYNGLKTTAAVDGQLQVNLNVKINDSTLRPADGILAIFDANEKVQIDGADARKMSNFGENMSINNQGDLLAIEKRPLFNQDTLHINTTGLTNRLYSLRFNPSQFQNASSALLIDHYTHSTQSIPLQSVSEYAFTIDANAQSKGPNRFDIVFEQAALQIATTKKLMAIELYPNPVSEGVINISMHQQKEGNYAVSIVNALGAEIQKENWHHSNGDQIHSINVNKLASGIYYLKISNEFGDQSMHKFIQSSSNF